MKAKWKLAIANAAVGAAIGFISSMMLHVPVSLFDALGNIYASGMGALLAFLLQIKPLLEKEVELEEKREEGGNSDPPDDPPATVVVVEKQANEKMVKMQTEKCKTKKKKYIGTLISW